MKKLTKFLSILFFVFSLHITLYTLHSDAAIPHLINYQGRLTDSSGIPLNGSYSLTFRIYDAETAGSLLWEETHSGALIQKGIFSVLLGSVTNLNIAFDKPYFPEIKVGNEVMSPRQRIVSSGYAISAEHADKIRASNSDVAPGYLDEKVGKSIVVNSNKIELSGDSVSPGISKYYGTDINGTKGWQTLFFIPVNAQLFTSSGIWVKPSGVSKVWVKVWGAGGGGGGLGGNATSGGGGGGAGRYAEAIINVSSNCSVVVGKGGAGGGNNWGSGGNGGNSSFSGDTIVTANGGSGVAFQSSAGGAGGSASGGSISLTGEDGGSASVTSNGTGVSGRGGNTYFGGTGGSAYSANRAGENGHPPGGGGGGGSVGTNAVNGGSGADGLVIVYW